MAAKNVVELNQSNWQSAVVDSALPVVVDFWAVWCGPCRMIAPHVEALADEYAGKVVVGKVNVDDNQDLATRFGIRAVPTLLLFQGGQVKETMVGMTGKKDLEKN